MDQTQDPIQSNSKNEENLENEREDEYDVHCARKEDIRCSYELDDSKQVRFEENGDNESANEQEETENHGEKDEHPTTESDIPEDNEVDDEEDDDDDKDRTPTPSADDDTEEQQETSTTELDEENIEDGEECPTTDNLNTTEESQRDSFAGSELSEEARPEEETEKDIIQALQKESQYDRTSSFSSLSVNIGSTQLDSDSELQMSSHASQEGDVEGETFDKSLDNEENIDDGSEGEVDAEELEGNEDESEENDESKEEREARLVKQAHLDIAPSPDTQEPEVDDDNANANDEPTSDDDAMPATEDDTMATAVDDTIETADAGLETTKDKEETEKEEEEEEEDDEEEHEEAELEKVPEVLVSSENKDSEEDEKEEQEETRTNPVSKEDHGEHTKVKEIGRIFQEKNTNAKAVYPKELITGEKTPVSVRRFREMFEHGEPRLSPAAYGTVPEEECTSPRPGIVKNLRDLFENPKNFEWKEAAKSATVVN